MILCVCFISFLFFLFSYRLIYNILTVDYVNLLCVTKRDLCFVCQVGEVALSILHSMVNVHSDLDDAGELVTPTPRVKRILSSSRCLPHIAQVIFLLLSNSFLAHHKS